MKGANRMSDFVIRAANVYKKYDRKSTLGAYTIDIPANGIVGIVGRNGSGKTTLMKMCAGLLDVSEGTLEVFGGSPMNNLAVLADLVYTYHHMTYEKQLKLQNILGNYQVMFPNFDPAFAGKLLAYFNLNPKAKYRDLSQGMASVFNFICGLSCRAKLTMFDEPVLGMDITVRQAAYEVLLRDYSEHPRTIMISSHLLSELEGVLSDLLLIDNGQVVLFSNIDDLRQSAYRVAGAQAGVTAFVQGKRIVAQKSGLSDEAVIFAPLDEQAALSAKQSGLTVSAVRPEDLCVYLTKDNKEGELECLWPKAN
jgi:ABC-2 type transport system ATP-binding protein